MGLDWRSEISSGSRPNLISMLKLASGKKISPKYAFFIRRKPKMWFRKMRALAKPYIQHKNIYFCSLWIFTSLCNFVFVISKLSHNCVPKNNTLMPLFYFVYQFYYFVSQFRAKLPNNYGWGGTKLLNPHLCPKSSLQALETSYMASMVRYSTENNDYRTI